MTAGSKDEVHSLQAPSCPTWSLQLHRATRQILLISSMNWCVLKRVHRCGAGPESHHLVQQMKHNTARYNWRKILWTGYTQQLLDMYIHTHQNSRRPKSDLYPPTFLRIGTVVSVSANNTSALCVGSTTCRTSPHVPIRAHLGWGKSRRGPQGDKKQ